MNERLTQHGDFFRTVLNATPNPNFVIDESLQVREVNRRASEFLQQDAEELLGHLPGEAVSCSYRQDDPRGCGFSSRCNRCVIRNSVNRAFKGHSIHRAKSHMYLEQEGKTRRVTLHVTASPFEFESSPFVLLTLEDITDRERMEEALLENENLKATQRMARTVAHEFRQPLGSLKLVADLVEANEDSPEILRTASQKIPPQIDRMNTIVNKLLSITRVQAKPYLGDVEILDISGSAGLLEIPSEEDDENHEEE